MGKIPDPSRQRKDTPESRDRLIIFARYPEPGNSKTRLIPALGREGAADLHRRMTECSLSWARRLARRFPVSLEVRYEGGDELLWQRWLGTDIAYRRQGPGDLGVRMAHAFAEAFSSGVNRAILVGTDIPDLDEDLAGRAFEALSGRDLVLGPARDGGYYLIGLRRPQPPLFEEIPWGTERVLESTLRAAEEGHLKTRLLECLEDVDCPENLPVWQRSSREKFPLISIVIPALNEENNISSCLASTRCAPNVERIVVDGGSQDRTREIALSWGAKVLSTPPGRARQMNAGARAAAGDLLLFLHADTRLPDEFADSVRETMNMAGVAAGAFEFRLDHPSPGLRWIERVANWRSRLLQLPYGDQAIFLRAALFRELGGFPELPIMEDFELIRRLRKRGRICTARLPAVTSDRRWQTVGLWRTTVINQLIVLAYSFRVSPIRLQRWYRGKS